MRLNEQQRSRTFWAKKIWGQKYDSGIEDASIVATHMILAAKSVGVDSCWVNFFDPEKASEAFQLPKNEEVLTFIALGYAAEKAEPLPITLTANRLSRQLLIFNDSPLVVMTPSKTC